MRRFNLNRIEDETGISGTGIVAEGVVFANGKAALSWRTSHTSVAVYDSMFALEAIHGHGGRTRIEWVDANDGPVLDADGRVIEAGATVIAATGEPDKLRVERVWNDDSGEGWISAHGWPECGYGLGASPSRKVRVVAAAEVPS